MAFTDSFSDTAGKALTSHSTSWASQANSQGGQLTISPSGSGLDADPTSGIIDPFYFIPDQGASGSAQWSEIQIKSTGVFSFYRGQLANRWAGSVNGQDYYELEVWNDNTLRVRRNVSGTYSTIATGTTTVNINDYIAFECSGAASSTQLKAFLNGAELTNMTLTGRSDFGSLSSRQGLQMVINAGQPKTVNMFGPYRAGAGAYPGLAAGGGVVVKAVNFYMMMRNT